MLKIGWTTVATAPEAETLSRRLVEDGLAVCCQVEGPISSTYRWKGKIETSREFRLMVKFLPEKQSQVETVVFSQHPYDTPEWIVVNAVEVGEKYLSWARSEAQTDRFNPN